MYSFINDLLPVFFIYICFQSNDWSLWLHISRLFFQLHHQSHHVKKMVWSIGILLHHSRVKAIWQAPWLTSCLLLVHVTHLFIFLCFFLFYLSSFCVVCTMLPVSLDCPFWIAPSFLNFHWVDVIISAHHCTALFRTLLVNQFYAEKEQLALFKKSLKIPRR